MTGKETKMKSIVKTAILFAGITASILVADKVIDHIVDKKKEVEKNEVSRDEEVIESNTETDSNSNDAVSTIVKAVFKSAIVTCAGLMVYEYGLENGVASGAAFFTRLPTTHEEAKKLVTDPKTFHEIMTLVRKER